MTLRWAGDRVESLDHRRVALATVLVAAHWQPGPWYGTAVTALVAWACSSGPTSPDADNSAEAKALDSVVPDEVLGHGGPLGHRRLAHSCLLPAAGWWLWHVQPVVSPVWPVWVFVGVWWGWVTHLAADFIWGRANPRVGLGRGIPLFLWWGHAGVGLDPGGLLARLASRLAALVAAYAALTLTGPLAAYWLIP